MSRDQKIKIGMVICAVVLVCTVIITATGMFGSSGIGGYADAGKYTAGAAKITGTVRNLDINWTSGKVTVAYRTGSTVTLEESAKRALNDSEKMRWWLDGETLRVQFAASGTHWNMPEKELTVTLPEGISLGKAAIRTTSGNMDIPALRAENLELSSTSGDITAAAETPKAAAASTSGDMRIRLAADAESAALSSTSGSIRLEAGKAGSISASSTSGGISITAAEAGSVTAGSTSGNIDIALGKMEKLAVKATSGSVSAKLPETPGFTASLEMTSGSLTSSLAMAKDGKQYTCGDGSAKVSIGTTSGNIRIDAYTAE